MIGHWYCLGNFFQPSLGVSFVNVANVAIINKIEISICGGYNGIFIKVDFSDFFFKKYQNKIRKYLVDENESIKQRKFLEDTRHLGIRDWLKYTFSPEIDHCIQEFRPAERSKESYAVMFGFSNPIIHGAQVINKLSLMIQELNKDELTPDLLKDLNNIFIFVDIVNRISLNENNDPVLKNDLNTDNLNLMDIIRKHFPSVSTLDFAHKIIELPPEDDTQISQVHILDMDDYSSDPCSRGLYTIDTNDVFRQPWKVEKLHNTKYKDKDIEAIKKEIGWNDATERWLYKRTLLRLRNPEFKKNYLYYDKPPDFIYVAYAADANIIEECLLYEIDILQKNPYYPTSILDIVCAFGGKNLKEVIGRSLFPEEPLPVEYEIQRTIKMSSSPKFSVVNKPIVEYRQIEPSLLSKTTRLKRIILQVWPVLKNTQGYTEDRLKPVKAIHTRIELSNQRNICSLFMTNRDFGHEDMANLRKQSFQILFLELSAVNVKQKEKVQNKFETSVEVTPSEEIKKMREAKQRKIFEKHFLEERFKWIELGIENGKVSTLCLYDSGKYGEKNYVLKFDYGTVSPTSVLRHSALSKFLFYRLHKAIEIIIKQPLLTYGFVLRFEASRIFESAICLPKYDLNADIVEIRNKSVAEEEPSEQLKSTIENTSTTKSIQEQRFDKLKNASKEGAVAYLGYHETEKISKKYEDQYKIELNTEAEVFSRHLKENSKHFLIAFFAKQQTRVADHVLPSNRIIDTKSKTPQIRSKL